MAPMIRTPQARRNSTETSAKTAENAIQSALNHNPKRFGYQHSPEY
jgi:hypothetical protein